MRTLVVCAGKNGATMECARYIEKGLAEESTVIDLTKEQPTNLEAYDTIVLGTSIYAGNAHSEVKRFIENNKEKLPNKRVFLFLSCLDGTKKEEYIATFLPEDIKEQTEAIVPCGGILDFTKLNFFERTIVKLIMKNEKDEQGNPITLKKDTVLKRMDYAAMDKLIAQINQ